MTPVSTQTSSSSLCALAVLISRRRKLPNLFGFGIYDTNYVLYGYQKHLVNYFIANNSPSCVPAQIHHTNVRLCEVVVGALARDCLAFSEQQRQQQQKKVFHSAG